MSYIYTTEYNSTIEIMKLYQLYHMEIFIREISQTQKEKNGLISCIRII
jgi:hypothetical protein